MANHDTRILMKYIKSILTDIKISEYIPEEFIDDPDFMDILDTLKSVREAASALGTGNLSYNIKGKGFTIGSLKNLQASLKNLTWKTKAIASGDFSQNVDFLGEFSDAFNSMTRKLESSIQEVNEAKEHFELIFQTIPDATMITVMETGKLIGYNKAFLEISGYSDEELKAKDMQMVDFYLDIEQREDLLEQLKTTGFCQNKELLLKSKSNNMVIGLISSKIIHIKGEPYILSVIRDITHLKEVESKLRESEERHRLLADNASDVIWMMDLTGQFTYVSPSVEKLRGFTVDEVKKQSQAELLCPDSLIHLQKGLADAIEDVMNNRPFGDFRGELEQPCKDGTTVWTETTVSGIYNEKGEFKGMLGVSRDISKRRIMEAEITRLSVTDKLTQIYNRLKIDEVLESELDRSARSKNPFTIIMLDIDHFKRVNDTYGHQVGDSVLVEIADIMKKHVRSIDIIGRWGGEEFFVILPQTDLAGGINLAQKLRAVVEQNHFTTIDKLTASFGVAVYQDDRTSASIVSRADKALYKAKENGRNCVETM